MKPISTRAGVRVVVGHEPRAYRELLAATLQLLLPDITVILVEPTDLDAAVAPGSETMIICSALTETIAQQSLAWVLLYPEGENLAIVNIAGRQRSIPKVELNDLLAVMAEVQTLPRHGAEEGGEQRAAIDPDVP